MLRQPNTNIRRMAFFANTRLLRKNHIHGSLMSNRSLILQFESRFHYGSCEHFFHFTWGYLLPAVHLISQNLHEKNKYIFRSCGPLMDLRIHEVMQACKINYEIKPKDFICEINETLVLPRWDVCLLKPLLSDTDISSFHAINTIQSHFANNKHLFNDCMAFDLAEAVASTKQFIVEAFNLGSKDELQSSRKLLVLKRSEEPEFYRKSTGAAEISGYGTGRRALNNPEEIAEELCLINIPATVFEQGRYSLREQIFAYRQAAGVIGIRGAEFANLLWLHQGSRVVLIDPLNINNPPVQKFLAELLLLDYRQINLNEGNHPNIHIDQLIPVLGVAV